LLCDDRVLAAFHYGNLTHPSQDAPKVGFLSTVPENAEDLLRAAVDNAQNNGGNFPGMFPFFFSCVSVGELT
jgi:hypothetical protein